MEYKGIDVSVFNGDINWTEVQENGIEFAMIRASYGSNGVDSKFVNNMNNIVSTTIKSGAYHYCYATNVQQAESEAEHFLDIIKPYKLYYPTALDIEEISIANLGKEVVTNIIMAFLNKLKEANYYAVLYTNPDWIENYIDTTRLADTEIWLSEWAPSPSYTENVVMWQYSNSGKIPGIDGNTDMNISFKNFPEIIKENGLNNTNQDSGGNNKPEKPNVPNPIVYIVKKGDNLWDISKRFLGQGDRYREIMALNGLTSDILYPGQILRIPKRDNSKPIFYIVKRGNTLWEIAQRFLGDPNRYREIMKLNGMTNDIIYPGQILKIPVENSNITITYRVQDGDTLWDIAKRFLNDGSRYKDIMELNGLTSDVIHKGESLKIPSN